MTYFTPLGGILENWNDSIMIFVPNSNVETNP